MTITNFGSCCIDNVYQVPHFARPGETLPCTAYAVHPGGKGLNQSLALARCGAEVRHAGKIGADGAFLKTLLDDAGVDTRALQVIEGPSGHANIQVTPEGENSIVTFRGANYDVGLDDIDAVLADCTAGDTLLIQNEISCLPDLMERAATAGLTIAFNAAPITAEVKDYPLDTIGIFIVNEIEGQEISGAGTPDDILDAMTSRFPSASIILTLGESGAIFTDGKRRVTQAAFPVTAVDTTGAGDTFTGYFLGNWARGKPVEHCLEQACRAAAVCVTRAGAATSIPSPQELALV